MFCSKWTSFLRNDTSMKFCMLLLHLKTSTPDYMVYGELGRYPISIDIKVRMIKFWCKLIMGKQSKLSHICYKLLYNNIFYKRWFFYMDKKYPGYFR